ncbi:MAG: carotenoid 1,2-hydratase [Pseudomonadota bacterium]
MSETSSVPQCDDRTANSTCHTSAFAFDRTVPETGYTWWYIDGVSDDGHHAFVIIAFVGSVFSPYYAWRGWQDPDNHCALNIALYGRPSRWAMTERGKGQTQRSPDTYIVGQSGLRVEGNDLIIMVDERAAPLPMPVRGRIVVSMSHQARNAFYLDANKNHFWQPICTSARVDVTFDAPSLSWSGHGYVDMNVGHEPITSGFDYWDWSRTPLPDGKTRVRYVTDAPSGDRRDLNLTFDRDGSFAHASDLLDCRASKTPIWRIERRAGELAGNTPRVHRTLEDTPFYSRSLLAYPEGAGGLTVHETLSCHRLRSGIVKSMLPFRMPRWPYGRAGLASLS